MAKKEVKKEVKKDEVMEKFHKGVDEIVKQTQDLKKKYNKFDSETKKNIKKGVIGVAALLGGLIGISALKHHKKEKEDKDQKTNM